MQKASLALRWSNFVFGCISLKPTCLRPLLYIHTARSGVPVINQIHVSSPFSHEFSRLFFSFFYNRWNHDIKCDVFPCWPDPVRCHKGSRESKSSAHDPLHNGNSEFIVPSAAAGLVLIWTPFSQAQADLLRINVLVSIESVSTRYAYCITLCKYALPNQNSSRYSSIVSSPWRKQGPAKGWYWKIVK